MSLTSGVLNQDVTYWGPGTQNRFGHQGYSTAVKLAGRWEVRTDLVRRPSGEEFTSTTRVFLNTDIEEGGWVALGDLTAQAAPTDDAYEVQAFRKVPDLRNLENLRIAYL